MKRNKPIVLLIAATVFLCGCDTIESHTSVTEDSRQFEMENPVVSYEATVTAEPQQSPVKMEETVPFTGFGKQTFHTGNLMINAKMGLSSEFFCAGSGEVFFTNFDDHEYLYRVTENGSELVVERPARYINCFDNKLYFLSSDSVSTADIDFTGEIYCYDPETDSCEIICNEATGSLTVSEDGIYYSVRISASGNSTTYENRLMDFESNAQKCFYSPEFRYGDYLILTDKAVNLKKEKNIAQPDYENAIPFSAGFSNSVGLCIYEEYLFYFSSNKDLVLLNLNDGSELSISRDEINALYDGNPVVISDYTLCGENLYLSHSSDMLTAVDLESMQMERMKVEGCSGKIVDRLYTDSTQMYALLKDSHYSNPEIVRLDKTESGFVVEKLYEA